MSYDIELVDPVTKECLELPFKHQLAGGTYAIGGTEKLRFNITYNYAPIFVKLFGEVGIRSLYGLSAADSLPILEKAISELKDDVAENYWCPTEGNVKRALYSLLVLAKLRPDGVWKGD